MIPKVNKGEDQRELFEWVKASEGLPEDKRHPNGSPMIIIMRRQRPDFYYEYRTLTPMQIADYFKYGVAEEWEWLKPITKAKPIEDNKGELKWADIWDEYLIAEELSNTVVGFYDFVSKNYLAPEKKNN